MSDNEAAGAIADNMTKVQGELATLDRIEAGFAVLEKQHPADVIIDVTTARGMKEATAARAAWRDPRIAVEKARKAAKAPVLELGRAIDRRAAELTLRLEVGELHYDGQIKAEEARKEAERQAKAEVEARRIAAHQGGLDSMRVFLTKVVSFDAASLAAAIHDFETIPPTGYEEFQAQADAAHAETIASLRRMHAAAVEREAEAARVAAEREELARLRAEQEARDRAERERIAAEQKAEAERLAQQRDEIERRERAAAAEIERQQAAARAEQARLDAEAAAERRRADAEAAAARAEQDRLARELRDADERRLHTERAELQRQQQEAAAAARRQEEARAAVARAEEAARREKQAQVEAAAPAMFDALKQWRNAEDADDSDELAAARIARDTALEAAGELLDIPY